MRKSNRSAKILLGVIGFGSLIVSTFSLPNLDKALAQSPTAPTTPATPASPEETKTRNLAELAQAAASAGSFTTLLKAVKAAGITDQLTGQKPYTVFAPTDAAFQALPKGTLQKLLQPANKQKLIRLLAYHVVPGDVTSSQLKSGKVKTVEGSTVNIKVDSASKKVRVNNAQVTQADISASNGVVHVINRVLLPPDLKL